MKTDKHIKNDKADALVPTEMLPDTDVEDIASSYASYLNLRDSQKRVLIAVLDDFMGGEVHTDVELAEIAGVSRKSVYNCKRNSRFTTALAQIMPELLKAKLPRYLAMIEKHGERDFQPLKFLLEYAGLYVPKQQRLNINASIDKVQEFSSLDEAIDAFLINIGSAGYPVEKLVERYQQLRAEGAF